MRTTHWLWRLFSVRIWTMPNENLTSSAWFSCSFWVILSPYVHSPVSWRKSWSEPPWRQEIFFFPLICMGASIFAIWWPVQWPHSVSPCLRSFRNLKTGWRKRIETAHARAINHRTLRNWRKTHPKIEIAVLEFLGWVSCPLWIELICPFYINHLVLTL